MIKMEGYLLWSEKEGFLFKRIYMDKATANIALTERFDEKDIINSLARVVPTNIVSYVDLKRDVKVKEKCDMCGGLGKIKFKKENDKEGKEVIDNEISKPSKSSKKEKAKEEKTESEPQMVNCIKCGGTREMWKETRAVVIY